MTIQIKDGTGGGKLAKVDDRNRLYVRTKSLQLQHVISEEDQDAYQVAGLANLSSGDIKGLHLYNSNDVKFMVITYIRHQVVGAAGGTAFPNTSNYFKVCSGLTYASGGDEITSTNVYIGSGNVSGVTSYDASTTPIVTTGTEVELERWYTQANGDMNRLKLYR
jgi:hypothetical protein